MPGFLSPPPVIAFLLLKRMLNMKLCCSFYAKLMRNDPHGALFKAVNVMNIESIIFSHPHVLNEHIKRTFTGFIDTNNLKKYAAAHDFTFAAESY